MCFIFSGKNEKLCRLLYQNISDLDDTYFYYDDGLKLLKNLANNFVVGDLILLDYNTYREFSEFMYDELRSKNLKIPVVLFGNPSLVRNERVQKWVSENEFYYDVQHLHTMIPIFRKLNNALESRTVKLILNAKSAERIEHVRAPTVKKRQLLEELRRESHFTPVMYRLLSFLYDKRGQEVSIESIAQHLRIRGASADERTNTTYAYISRLRKCIEKSPWARQYNLKILRARKGFYLLCVQ